MTPTPQTDQPATAAGRALLRSLDEALTSLPRSAYEPAILAIEAEARAAQLAQDDAAVRGIMAAADARWDEQNATVARANEQATNATNAMHAADERVLALREALDKVSVYVLTATWPKDTPMEAHRQEVIAVLDGLNDTRIYSATSEPVSQEGEGA